MNNNNIKDKILTTLGNNKVVVLFVLLCIAAIWASGSPLTFVGGELFTRIGRNGFTVLSLLIPVLAGMGLNFGITIGAVAAQFAMFWVIYWGFTGLSGWLLALVLATPIAMFLGYLVGALFNRMKGSEMIAGLVLGYFADGIYQFIFLFVIGGIIPMNEASGMIINGGVGVKNTIDLTGNLKYALDNVSMLNLALVAFIVAIVVAIARVVLASRKGEKPNYKQSLIIAVAAVVLYALTYVPAIEHFLAADRLRLMNAVMIGLVAVVIKQLIDIVIFKMGKAKRDYKVKKSIALIIVCAIFYALTYIPAIEQVLMWVSIPVATYLAIVALCFFNSWLLRTRLGQDMRTVGQSRTVANAAGINVDRTRIIAMVLSTVLACWGQLIYLQNIGTFSTYGAHTQVGQFAIAALLVGGASVRKATNKQAIIGVILFHTLFIVAPQAGKELFNNAQLGEYFRVFVAYGVIAVSLAMHAWKTVPKKKDEEKKEETTETPAITEA